NEFIINSFTGYFVRNYVPASLPSYPYFYSFTLKRRRAFSITIIAAPVSLNTAIHSVSIPKNIRTNAANFIVMENQVRLGKSPSCDYRSQTPKKSNWLF
ncbi:hypothetical protein, partial [Staphylococcus hominis]